MIYQQFFLVKIKNNIMKEFSIIYGIGYTHENAYIKLRLQRLQSLFPYVEFCPSFSNQMFNLGQLKNRGFNSSSGNFILLSDPDFFTDTTFFRRIKFYIESTNKTSFFTFPVYHANQKNSDIIFNATNVLAYDKLLINFFSNSIYSEIKSYCDFISPYSNVILTSRNIFQYLGGYNENYIGYGSEDFDLMIRAMLALDVTPFPSNFLEDCFRPNSKDYFFMRPYHGFRRMLEAYSFQMEIAGFRFVHIYHPKGTTDWYKRRDKNRKALKREIKPYLDKPYLLLDKDWLPHSKKIACVLTDKQRWRLFLTLRCSDYYTVRYTGEINCADIHDFCNTNEIDSIAFTDDICTNEKYKYIAYQLSMMGYKIVSLSSKDFEAVGIFPINIHKESYASSRLGLGLAVPNINYKWRRIIGKIKNLFH